MFVGSFYFPALGCWVVGSVVFVESVVFVGSFLLPLRCSAVVFVWSVVFVGSFLLPLGCCVC